MDKKEIEVIKKMVIHGIYKVCIMNGYNSTMFSKFKAEQNRLFDNFILNRNLLEEREKNLLEDWKKVNRIILIGGFKYD